MSSGNGWHTTYEVGVVCYTTTRWQGKACGLSSPLVVFLAVGNKSTIHNVNAELKLQENAG